MFVYKLYKVFQFRILFSGNDLFHKFLVMKLKTFVETSAGIQN